MGDVGNVCFVFFRAVGAPRGAEMQHIENREGAGALAFDGHLLNNTCNNQRKVGFLGGEDKWEGARLRQNLWGGRYPIVWGGELGDKIFEKLRNKSWSLGATDDKEHTTIN